MILRKFHLKLTRKYRSYPEGEGLKNRLIITATCWVLTGIIVMLSAYPVMAKDRGELAKKLANPIASLISVPLQLNYDKDIGPQDEGSQWLLNIQPVIPFAISENWNIITRTILPLWDKNDIPAKGLGESGLGDIVASQFFSPKALTDRGWT